MLDADTVWGALPILNQKPQKRRNVRKRNRRTVDVRVERLDGGCLLYRVTFRHNRR